MDELKPGYKSTELWIAIAAVLKIFGLDEWINPDQLDGAVQQVEQLTDHIGVIVNSSPAEPFWLYLIAVIYVSGRMGIKMMQIRYGKIDGKG